MRICFGLHGGIGNALFCLPSIKALSRSDSVIICAAGDYPMSRLFERCRYGSAAAAGSLPDADAYICGQYAPPQFQNIVSRGYMRCGFPTGTTKYDAPEWRRIKWFMNKGVEREDVRDWIRDLGTVSDRVDVGLIPGCKPGPEWSRKKWPGFADLSIALDKLGFSLRAFGTHEEVAAAGLADCWDGAFPLEEIPERLARCHVIVGTDSGITHLASSIGVPCVVIYTATSPIKGDPVGPSELTIKLHRGLPCSPCQSTPRWRECTNWICRDIPVEDVLRAALRLRAGGSSK